MATADALQTQINELHSSKTKCKDRTDLTEEEKEQMCKDADDKILGLRNEIQRLEQQQLDMEPPNKRRKTSSLGNLPSPNQNNNNNNNNIDSNEIDDFDQLSAADEGDDQGFLTPTNDHLDNTSSRSQSNSARIRNDENINRKQLEIVATVVTGQNNDKNEEIELENNLETHGKTNKKVKLKVKQGKRGNDSDESDSDNSDNDANNNNRNNNNNNNNNNDKNNNENKSRKKNKRSDRNNRSKNTRERSNRNRNNDNNSNNNNNNNNNDSMSDNNNNYDSSSSDSDIKEYNKQGLNKTAHFILIKVVQFYYLYILVK